MRGTEHFRLLDFRFRFDQCAGFLEVKQVFSQEFLDIRYIYIFGRFVFFLKCEVSK